MLASVMLLLLPWLTKSRASWSGCFCLIDPLMNLLKRPVSKGHPFWLMLWFFKCGFHNLRTHAYFQVLESGLSVADKYKAETLTLFYHYQKQESSTSQGRWGEGMGVLGRGLRIPLPYLHSSTIFKNSSLVHNFLELEFATAIVNIVLKTVKEVMEAQ